MIQAPTDTRNQSLQGVERASAFAIAKFERHGIARCALRTVVARPAIYHTADGYIDMIRLIGGASKASRVRRSLARPQEGRP